MKQSECPLPTLTDSNCPTHGSAMCRVRSAGVTMPGRTLTGYAPACLAPETTCATSAVAACVRYNPTSYRLTLLTIPINPSPNWRPELRYLFPYALWQAGQSRPVIVAHQ